MGKLVVAAALALVAGLFVGGLGPRAELARVRTELEAARAAAARSSGGGSMLPFALGLGGLAAAQAQQGKGAAGTLPPPRFQNRPEPLPPGGSAPAPSADPDAGQHGGEGRGGGGPADFAAARTAMALRAAQFRAAFVERAQLTPAAQTALDGTIAEMNRELREAAGELEGQLAGQDKLGPRQMADIGARVLDVYRRADDRFKAGLTDQGRAAAAETDFDLLTQIDLGALEGLAQRVSQMEPRRSVGSTP